MIPKNITKKDLLKAIREIDEKGIRNGRHSSTYDLMFNNKSYPPKLVLSIANRFANGEELNPQNFKGGKGTDAFKKLKQEGFIIREKITLQIDTMSFYDQLKLFLTQAKTDNLKTKHFKKSIGPLTVKVSFGQGVPARIPWISFLKKPFTTSQGIYPVYLYYKKLHKLVLAYGISETSKPQVSWVINNPKTIKDLFSENALGKPDRYGDSYLFKIYDINDLPNDDILDKDLNQLLKIYNAVKIEKSQEGLKSKFQIEKLFQDFDHSGLKFRRSLLTRFVSSLSTKPFVLLTGLSGSGKTKLAQSFAKWLCENKSQYAIIPVGADWTNREPLLGYVNALDPSEYIIPENGALRLIIEANKNEGNPYFLILDEMNLSHVERYFADFLSVMESKDNIKLHSDYKTKKSDVPYEISWPRNLFIIGTVNIDETTYMFSPKVLDRANVIEFRINPKDMALFLDDPKKVKDLGGQGSTMGKGFVNLTEQNVKSNSKTLSTVLNEYFEQLEPIGAEFGYRTASEIQTFVEKIKLIDGSYSENEMIDFAIMQKLLPKLHGSRSKLVPVLKSLAYLCYENKEDLKTEMKDKIFEKSKQIENKIRFPISFEKISRMHKNVIENGFTSYAEA